MIIKLSPVRSDAVIVVSRLRDQLTINGIAWDFTQLPEGASLPAEAVDCADVLDPIYRLDGKLVVSLRLPHAADAPESARFPVDIIDPPDGAVSLPGLNGGEHQPAVAGVIDWSKVISAEDKAAAAAAQVLGAAIADIAARRSTADAAIAPLQDAVDLGEGTE
ncbi:hypothetical protein ACMSI7_28725, partial [Pseudomonas faucium]|uniref:hypothetical protein n=1 Tax=Pseudomonas faucium TaxID=2740518 RepID=UPI0039C133E4